MILQHRTWVLNMSENHSLINVCLQVFKNHFFRHHQKIFSYKTAFWRHFRFWYQSRQFARDTEYFPSHLVYTNITNLCSKVCMDFLKNCLLIRNIIDCLIYHNYMMSDFVTMEINSFYFISHFQATSYASLYKYNTTFPNSSSICLMVYIYWISLKNSLHFSFICHFPK